MSAIEKWAERVYAETDFGRSVAISVAGALGLAIYLFVEDWVIAAFCSIIFFPIARLIATAIHQRVNRNANEKEQKRNAQQLYERLSDQEREVVSAFVKAGTCVLTWGQVNALSFPASAIESLMQRDVLSTSMTADCMRETFVLDSALFDVGLSKVKLLANP